MAEWHIPAMYGFILLLLAFSLSQADNCDKNSTLPKGRTLVAVLTRNNNCSKFSLDDSVKAHLTNLETTIILPAIYSIVLLIGLPANGVAFWVLAAKTKKSPSTFFLLNLAIADLMFALILPFKISYHFLGNNWLFGEALCRAVSALFYGNIYGSILFLMCISVDRYISLVHPFMARGLQRRKAALCVSFGIWLVVIAAVIPLLLKQQSSSYENVSFTTCHDVELECKDGCFSPYFLSLVILGFAIPFVVIVYCYGAILIKLIPKKKDHGPIIRLLALVLLSFILFFSPCNVLLFLQSLRAQQERLKDNQMYIWYTIAQALSSFNNCIDPFIYYYASRDFRAMVKSVVCCCKETNKKTSGRTSETLILKKSISYN
ncbi:proteinase-activated receptor 4-like [Rhinatrema bivittatum]|uniref:proteinase-activated receptor 4-like n=1 Tax=Rhinatrema bivittatum TaxID=194408 RepID=UPI001127407C|nr:proteinase-activated receptor 4-like [Rhinatrema bivittatum]